MHLKKHFCVTAVMSLCVFVAAVRGSGPTTDERLAFFRRAVEQNIKEFEVELGKPGAQFEARQFTLYAHYVMSLGQDPAKAAAALRRVMALQNMNASSRAYGEFAAREGVAGESGAATDFTVLPLVQVLLRYGEKLPPDLRDQLTERMKLVLPILRQRKLPPDAGNLFLLNAADMLLIGELVNDERAIAEAEARFETFIGVAKSRGISEYVSPNYSAVQLSCLLIARNYTHQPAAARVIDPSIRFLWASMAANAYCGSLAGPHGRDMDFAFGSGAIESYLFLENLRDEPPPLSAFNEALRAYLNYVEGAPRPDAGILELARIPERIVRQRWGITSSTDRYLYITPEFAIGSSSAAYTMEDRKLTVDFPATAKRLPTMWVVADPYDAPYGRVRNSRGQQVRPAHLAEWIAAVQDKSTILALTNVRGAARGQAVPSVATNIIIPMNADLVMLDGKPIATGKPFEMPVTTESTIVVRDGAGVAAARIFAADGMAGQAPAMVLKFDGNPMNMGRLVAYHYRAAGQQSPPAVPDEPCRAGIMLIAGKAATEAELQAFLQRIAAIKIEQSGDAQHIWRGKLIDGTTTLEAALDGQNGNVAARKVNGEDYLCPVFKVNDRDVAGEMLGY